MKQSEEALNEKLARWAGFQKAKMWGWYPPASSELPLGDLPDFCHSLDACFKWLVPKCGDIDIERRCSEDGYCDFGVVVYSRSGDGEGCDIDPALALCRAIEKLIDG